MAPWGYSTLALGSVLLTGVATGTTNHYVVDIGEGGDEAGLRAFAAANGTAPALPIPIGFRELGVGEQI